MNKLFYFDEGLKVETKFKTFIKCIREKEMMELLSEYVKEGEKQSWLGVADAMPSAPIH